MLSGEWGLANQIRAATCVCDNFHWDEATPIHLHIVMKYVNYTVQSGETATETTWLYIQNITMWPVAGRLFQPSEL